METSTFNIKIYIYEGISVATLTLGVGESIAIAKYVDSEVHIYYTAHRAIEQNQINYS